MLIKIVNMTLAAFSYVLFSSCEHGRKHNVVKIAGAILGLVLPWSNSGPLNPSTGISKKSTYKGQIIFHKGSHKSM